MQDDNEEPAEDVLPPQPPSPDDPGSQPWRQAQAERAARAVGLYLKPGSTHWKAWQREIDRVLGDLNRTEHTRAWERAVPGRH